MGQDSYANAINNSGQVVGRSTTLTNSNNGYATLWNSGTITDLGTLGGSYGGALALNNSGQIVGYSQVFGGAYHATLWDNSNVIDLGTLGQDSYANAINNSGQVVGWSFLNNNGQPRAILWDNGTMTDLNIFLPVSLLSDGWVMELAIDINDNGSIVGRMSNPWRGSDVSFLLTYCESCPVIPPNPIAAVPEPETYAMLLAGLGLLGFTVKRRKQSA